MTFDWSTLGAVPPTALTQARLLAHHAAQWPTRAARANLAPLPDDSHSTLDWHAEHRALLSQPMPTHAGAVRIGVRVADFELIVLRDNTLLDSYTLSGKTHSVTAVWLDSALRVLGLKAASEISLPYPAPYVAEVKRALQARSQQATSLEELARWYEAAAQLLEEFASQLVGLQPGPEPVRCWPHHFDIATLVRFERGSAETARTIGVGMSPGDNWMPQPYLYVQSTPRFDPAQLPELPPPGCWQTEGFVAAVVSAESILALEDRSRDLRAFVDNAFVILRARMGL